MVDAYVTALPPMFAIDNFLYGPDANATTPIMTPISTTSNGMVDPHVIPHKNNSKNPSGFRKQLDAQEFHRCDQFSASILYLKFVRYDAYLSAAHDMKSERGMILGPPSLINNGNGNGHGNGDDDNDNDDGRKIVDTVNDDWDGER